MIMPENSLSIPRRTAKHISPIRIDTNATPTHCTFALISREAVAITLVNNMEDTSISTTESEGISLLKALSGFPQVPSKHLGLGNDRLQHSQALPVLSDITGWICKGSEMQSGFTSYSLSAAQCPPSWGAGSQAA